MNVPLRDRVRTLRRVITKNAAVNRKTAVLVLGTRIMALSEDDGFIVELKQQGAVLVGVFPMESGVPDEDTLFAAVDHVLDLVADLRQVAETAVRRSATGKLLGSSHPNAKLTEGVVEAMRRAHAPAPEGLGMGSRAIAIVVGIPRATVQSVLSGRRWPHVH